MAWYDPQAEFLPSHALRSQLAYTDLRGIMPRNA